MSSSVGSLIRLHQHAAQPDVVLSQDRDSYYADTMIGESAAELMETLLGSRRATILSPELKALASFLYFGLTNFVGKPRNMSKVIENSLLTASHRSAADMYSSGHMLSKQYSSTRQSRPVQSSLGSLVQHSIVQYSAVNCTAVSIRMHSSITPVLGGIRALYRVSTASGVGSS